MKFTVPQFIERETPIVGPLTLRQFIFIAIGGGICFFLYFIFAKSNFFLFIVLSVITLGTFFAFAFLQIGGKSLPTVLVNALKFTFGPKKYLWRKREVLTKVLKKEKEEELKIGEKSQIKKIKSLKGLY